MYLTNKVLVVDNFYKDPDAIRNLALQQEFLDCNHPERSGSWPGLRSKFLNNISEELTQQFRDLMLNTLLEGVIAKYNCYFETNFQLCYAEHGDSWVHTDVGPWPITHVGVIYLNPNPAPDSGTIIYELKKEYTDEFKQYAAKKNNMWTTLNRDQDKEEFNKWFTPSLNIPNKYNRAVIYNPSQWHKADHYFGNSKETGRLIQPFFANIQYS